MKLLYIVRGPFGSGKTEFAKTITDNVVSSWDYYAKYGKNQWSEKLKPYSDEYCRTSIKSLMEGGINKIAVTNSFSKNQDLDYFYALADKHGYDVFFMVMDNRNIEEFQRDVPEDVVLRQVIQLKSNMMFSLGL